MILLIPPPTHRFPRIHNLIVLAQPDLRLALIHNMLNKRLLGVLGLEFANPPWIPEVAGHAEVLAAAHHGVGLTPFRRSRYAVWREVILFAARYRNKSIKTHTHSPISQCNPSRKNQP